MSTTHIKPKKHSKPLPATMLVFSTCAALAQTAHGAADVPPPPPDDAFAIEEITVTARRTQENIQEVPLAITALSSDDLARESITSAQDLMGKVGSLVIGPNSAMRNSESPNIRGQGATFSASPGVVMYWSEVPLPLDAFANNQGGPGMLFDVQNLQVLKGPQGTLFGRNTTGGAFVIEPTKPQDNFSARVQGEAGNYNDRAYEAVVNTPLYTGDEWVWLLRLGGQSVERDGYTKDVITGKDYDDKNYWTSRLGLTARVGENIENTLLGYYTERKENGTGVVFEGINAPALNAFVSSALGGGAPDPNSTLGCDLINSQGVTTNCGQDLAEQQQARDIRHVAMSGDPMDELETGGLVDLFSWQIDDALTLRNILSWASYKRRFNWDQDGGLVVLNDIRASDAYSTDSETMTEELQLQGTLSEQGLKYVTGVYVELNKPQSVQENPTEAFGTLATQYYEIEKRSRAIYAQGDLSLGALNSSLDGWTLTAGVRRTIDEMEGDASLINLRFSIVKEDEHTKQNANTWLLGASYQFDNAMAYGKIARGYKTGGFTGLAANPANFYYDPEYVLSYELGVKSDFDVAEMPLRLNAAVFLSEYDDMQRVAPETYDGAVGLATLNAGEAEIKGFEMDFILLATQRLRLMGNYSYTDAKFKEFLVPRQAATPQRDCTGQEISGGAIGDYSCMPFSEIPEQQYSLSVAYELPLDVSVGSVEASLTYSWVDERYTAALSVPEAEPGAWLDDYNTVNASVSWRDVFESHVDVQLFGTNLTDEEYRVANSNVWNQFAFKNSMWSEPRMYGVRIGYRWGDE